MDDERLNQLLKDADALAGEPSIGREDLASRVRQLAVRRRRQRTAAGLVSAVVILAVAVVWWTSVDVNSTREPIVVQQSPTESIELDQIRSELAELREELRQLAAQRRCERLVADLERRLERSGAAEAVQVRLDQTAAIIVHQGDQLFYDLNDREAAVASYQRVIDLFPGSRWSQIARDRLSEMQEPEGDRT